jgi:hypothetical protein
MTDEGVFWRHCVAHNKPGATENSLATRTDKGGCSAKVSITMEAMPSDVFLPFEPSIHTLTRWHGFANGVHDHALGVQVGYYRTAVRLQLLYCQRLVIWPGILKVVKERISSCDGTWV